MSDSPTKDQPLSGVIHICNLTPFHGEGIDRNNKLWRWDFGEYTGPVFVGINGDPLKNQPMKENHPAWEPFNRWLAETWRKP